MFDKALHYLRRSWVVGQLLTRISFEVIYFFYFFIILPDAKPKKNNIVAVYSPWETLGNLKCPPVSWVSVLGCILQCPCVQRTWESFRSAQGCPSMVSAWSKNLPVFSEVRLARRRGHGVWDEGEQPHNVPHFCWKYIGAGERSGSPWDARLRAEAAPDPVACL